MKNKTINIKNEIKSLSDVTITTKYSIDEIRSRLSKYSMKELGMYLGITPNVLKKIRDGKHSGNFSSRVARTLNTFMDEVKKCKTSRR